MEDDMAQLWGGRFTKETDKLVYAFNASILFDRKLYRQDIRGSKAHADMLARQDNYTNLHNFREKASDGLGMEGDDLRVRLEMWFAEVEAFRKEAAFCDAMAADINAAFTGSRPSKAKLPPDLNDALGLLCEWETSAKQSKLWHEYDMAPIVLWDDSVAAKYCATLPWWKKKMVVRRIKKAIGRYPDWYLNEEKKGH